jgi:hypothetical protein
MSANNEPAFPQFSQVFGGLELFGGMTLRDYFAGQVLAGWMSDASANPCDEVVRNHIAEHSYRLADAMLQARQGGAS